jgi:hypothetical protein
MSEVGLYMCIDEFGSQLKKDPDVVDRFGQLQLRVDGSLIRLGVLAAAFISPFFSLCLILFIQNP